MYKKENRDMVQQYMGSTNKNISAYASAQAKTMIYVYTKYI